MLDLSIKAITKITENLVFNDPDVHKSVSEAIQNEDGKGTYNSKGWVELDRRYNGLLPIAKDHDLVPILIKRGCKILSLYNPSSDQLYLFLNKKTLREQFKKGSNTYYVKVLNLLNEELNTIVPKVEQLNLFLEEKYIDSFELEMKELARKLLIELPKNPSKVFVFTYDNRRLIPQVEAMAFNTKQEVVWIENYSYLLDSNYGIDLQSDGIDSGTKVSSMPIEKKDNLDKKQIVKLKSN